MFGYEKKIYAFLKRENTRMLSKRIPNCYNYTSADAFQTHSKLLQLYIGGCLQTHSKLLQLYIGGCLQMLSELLQLYIGGCLQMLSELLYTFKKSN